MSVVTALQAKKTDLLKALAAVDGMLELAESVNLDSVDVTDGNGTTAPTKTAPTRKRKTRKTAASTAPTTGKKRGRPKKSEATVSLTPKKRGRPKATSSDKKAGGRRPRVAFDEILGKVYGTIKAAGTPITISDICDATGLDYAQVRRATTYLQDDLKVIGPGTESKRPVQYIVTGEYNTETEAIAEDAVEEAQTELVPEADSETVVDPSLDAEDSESEDIDFDADDEDEDDEDEDDDEVEFEDDDEDEDEDEDEDDDEVEVTF